MTLQQLRYIIEIAQSGSISLAAQRLFITQPSLSKSVADLEKEMGITIFYRGSRGVMLSPDGVKFLAYARQVVEQADLLEQQYKFGTPVRRVFALSAQHYAVVASAFIDLVREYREDQYEFTLRESRTYDIIEDVRTQRSELGILFLSHFNREVLLRIIRDAELEFVPLFTARPHIFVSTDHPLARRSSVTLDELRSYPRLVYEQGLHNSFSRKSPIPPPKAPRTSWSPTVPPSLTCWWDWAPIPSVPASSTRTPAGPGSLRCPWKATKSCRSATSTPRISP